MIAVCLQVPPCRVRGGFDLPQRGVRTHRALRISRTASLGARKVQWLPLSSVPRNTQSEASPSLRRNSSCCQSRAAPFRAFRAALFPGMPLEVRDNPSAPSVSNGSVAQMVKFRSQFTSVFPHKGHSFDKILMHSSHLEGFHLKG